MLKQIEENTWGRLVKTESKGSGEFADVSMGVNAAKLLLVQGHEILAALSKSAMPQQDAVCLAVAYIWTGIVGH